MSKRSTVACATDPVDHVPKAPDVKRPKSWVAVASHGTMLSLTSDEKLAQSGSSGSDSGAGSDCASVQEDVTTGSEDSSTRPTDQQATGQTSSAVPHPSPQLRPQAPLNSPPRSNAPDCKHATNSQAASVSQLTSHTHLHQCVSHFAALTNILHCNELEGQEAAVRNIQGVIQGLWPNATLKVYGSVAYKLALPSSDIDTVVCGVPEAQDAGSIKAALLKLQNKLDEQPWTASTKCIPNSTIPLLKVKTHCSEHNRMQSSAELHPHSSEDSTPEGPYVRLDLSFMSPQHCGLPTTAFVTKLISHMPSIHPLALIVKQILRERRLNDAYTGGVSSYGLILLLAAYLAAHQVQQAVEDPDLGLLLLGFLEYYGGHFDPLQCTVSLSAGGFSPRSGFSENSPIQIQDPINPATNVGRCSYRFSLIQRIFLDVASSLQLLAQPMEADTIQSMQQGAHQLLQAISTYYVD